MAKLSNTPEKVAVTDTNKKPVYTIISEDEDEDDVENRVYEKNNKIEKETEVDNTGIIDTENEEENEFRVEENISKKDMLFLLLGQAAPITLSFFLSMSLFLYKYLFIC
jgi:archaellum component FlaD/FlaE